MGQSLANLSQNDKESHIYLHTSSLLIGMIQLLFIYCMIIFLHCFFTFMFTNNVFLKVALSLCWKLRCNIIEVPTVIIMHIDI